MLSAESHNWPDRSKLPRLAPEMQFPPYSYVTGRFPHPLRDPEGHAYGKPEVGAAPLDPADWPACDAYCQAIDLFNHGFYWEAHEAWEQVWIALGRTGETADFVKGLIKLAAAGVKAREGRANGVQRHAQRAEQLIRLTAGLSKAGEQYAGLELQELIRISQALIRAPEEFVDRSDDPVKIVLPPLVCHG